TALTRLVQRWGRSGFALRSSLVWALPLAAWAGSVDLSPTVWTWVAFWVGLGLLAGWAALLVWVNRVPVPARPRRLDLRAMSPAERRWNVLFAVCVLGLIGWLNAAATVDWRVLTGALNAARPGLILVAVAI